MSKYFPYVAVFTFLSLTLKSLYVKYSVMEQIKIAGFLTELSFLALLILLISTLKGRMAAVLFSLLNAAVSVLSLTAIMYFDYYDAIFTYQSLREMNQVFTIRDSIFTLFRIQYVLLFIDLIALGFWMGVKRRIVTSNLHVTKKLACFITVPAALFIALGIMNASNTLSEVNKYDTLGLVGYQFVSAASDLNAKWRGDNIINAETLQKRKISPTINDIRFHGAAQDKNVIIVQLESVQNFLVGLKIGDCEVTPNLNSFLQEAQYFPNFYTQVGKGNTSDAEFITNTSINALGETSMSSAIKGKKVPSLPRMLKHSGYHTATFHANDVKFWSRDALYRSLGFDEFYDRKYFGSDDLISYGVSDELLYKKSIRKLSDYKQAGKKFYAHIIALSSHFPYELPESKKRLTIDLPGKYKDSAVGSYIKSVSYADYAFGTFVESLKKAGLYEDSLIAVYGDHQGLQTENEKDRKLVEELLQKPYHSVLDHLNVPFIVKIPSEADGEIVETVGGLVDIYPTIANILGLNLKDEVVFGTDLLNSKDNLIGIRFYAPTGTYINQCYAFSPGKTKDTGQKTLLANRSVSPAHTKSINELERILDLLKLSDDYVRSLK